MRWKYFRITGYYGIYDGMGLDTIVIPFDKCVNDICLIVGRNGSGKSTILFALSPIPDNSIMFRPNVNAEKEGILDVNGTEYRFLIRHHVDGKGGRKPTKAFMWKNAEDLNPNGNVTSYMEVLESEFDMDPNFITLTNLSSEDRGIADKKPAERKRYVSRMVDCLGTYNTINRSLSRKSSVFRSHINTLSSKMNSIGDLDSAKHTLASIDARIVALESYISDTQAELAKCTAKIDSIDTDGSIQQTYTDIANGVEQISKELDDITSKLNRAIAAAYGNAGTIVSIESVDADILTNESLKTAYKMEIESTQKTISDLISTCTEMSSAIQLKQQRYEALKVEIDDGDIEEQLKKYRDIVNSQEATLKLVGLYGVDVSKEEFSLIFEKMVQYRDASFALMDWDEGQLRKAIEYVRNGMLDNDMICIRNDIEKMKDEISSMDRELQRYNGMLETMEVLKKRPDECSIDACPFISKALECAGQNPEEKIEDISSHLSTTRLALDAQENRLANLIVIGTIRGRIMEILNDAKANEGLISKFAESRIFLDRNEYLNRLGANNAFNEVVDCDKYILLANSIDGYHTNVTVLKDLEAKKLILDSKESMIEEVSNDIEEAIEKLDKTRELINENESHIGAKTALIERIEILLSKLHVVRDYLVSLDQKSSEKAELKTRYLAIKNDLASMKDYIDKANRYRADIDKAAAELDPIKKDRESLQYSILRAEEYAVELKQYQDKYNTIEILKKYSSPSSGIQTVYMNMYMNKTVAMANELLQYMFDGYLELLPYVINENEFRIPVKHGNGLISDDITSCSTAQICMISIATTVALMRQASNVYDIIRFDEMDGGLDTNNRIYFIDNVLKRMIKDLGIQQIIMSSHAIESNMVGVDLIKLAVPSTCDHDYTGANIIFDYEEARE